MPFLVFTLWLFGFATAYAAGEPTGSLAQARYGHAAAMLPDGRVIVVGGDTVSGSLYSQTASVEIYDPNTGTFTAGPPLGTTRSGHTATALADGRVLVAGGQGLVGGSLRTLATAEIYDPVSNTWTPVGSMTAARRSAKAFALADGRALIIGGDSTSSTCEVFDPVSGTFTATSPLLSARQTFAATVLLDGRVLVAGGGFAGGPYLNSVEIWDPATGAWTASGTLSSTRMYATATTLPDGRVLVAGGGTTSSFSTAIAAAEFYDPATATVSPAGSLSVPRMLHSAAVMGDGNVAIIGGTAQTASWELSVERFNVSAKTWFNGGQLASTAPTPVTLADGKVLVVGGDHGSPSSAATLIDSYCVSARPIISPRSASFPWTGGSGSVQVSSRQGCYWSVQSAPLWMTITSGSEGTGDGTVSYQVAEQTGGARSATALIADSTFNVSQSAHPCAGATITPTSQSFTGTGGSATVTVTANATCNWTVTNLPSWVTMTSGGTGSATLTYSVAANTGSSRSAIIVIAGQDLYVSQTADACYGTYISPASQLFGYAGGTGSVSLTVPSGCSWTVNGKPTWITMTTSGTGSKTLSVTAAANTGAERTATMTIGTGTYSVTQAGGPCAGITITPASASFTTAGGSLALAISAPATCTWYVTGKPTWLTSASSGTGNGTLTLSAAINTGAARSASLSIGGVAFPVTQAGDPCYNSVTLSPTSQSFTATGGSASISVTTVAGCGYSVVNIPTWITINSGSSGTGSGVINYTVAANTGSSRTAALLISGRSFSVSQAAAPVATCTPVSSIAAGSTLSGTLASTDCVGGARGTSYYTDSYSFSASPGQQVAFYLSSSSFDTYLYLRDPSGTVIASNDDGGGGTNSRIPASSGVFTLPAGSSGTYVIEVTSYATRATGSYSLQRLQ